MSVHTVLRFGLPGLSYTGLSSVEGLHRLDGLYLARLRKHSPALHDSLLAYRADAKQLNALQTSALLLECAPVLETFIAGLFSIQAELEQSTAQTLAHAAVLEFKKEFVLKRAKRRLHKPDVPETFAELDAWLNQSLAAAGINTTDREHAVARLGKQLLAADNVEAIEKLTRWCVLAFTDAKGRAAVRGWASFKLPQTLDYAHLTPAQSGAAGLHAAPEQLRRRDGFALTDTRMSARAVQDQVHYCIYCHDHDGDFCSKGFPEKKGAPERGLRVNPLGVTLTGCPLEEKISEMHSLKRDGRTIAALR
ncbi:MAG: pyridine nucleotide-disulfide oxidoreductase, partial [Gammaproteobacteria bacterium]|nr:pyridine nucleotide-disulfide oxidoreductase [Gammaproteobacteria bacterium]